MSIRLAAPTGRTDMRPWKLARCRGSSSMVTPAATLPRSSRQYAKRCAGGKSSVDKEYIGALGYEVTVLNIKRGSRTGTAGRNAGLNACRATTRPRNRRLRRPAINPSEIGVKDESVDRARGHQQGDQHRVHSGGIHRH